MDKTGFLLDMVQPKQAPGFHGVQADPSSGSGEGRPGGGAQRGFRVGPGQRGSLAPAVASRKGKKPPWVRRFQVKALKSLHFANGC